MQLVDFHLSSLEVPSLGKAARTEESSSHLVRKNCSKELSVSIVATGKHKRYCSTQLTSETFPDFLSFLLATLCNHIVDLVSQEKSSQLSSPTHHSRAIKRHDSVRFEYHTGIESLLYQIRQL